MGKGKNCKLLNMKTLFSNSICIFLIWACGCLAPVQLKAQSDSVPQPSKDSLSRRLRHMLEEAPADYAKKYQQHTAANEQDALLDELLRTIRHTRDFLKTGLDTNSIKKSSPPSGNDSKSRETAFSKIPVPCKPKET